METLLFGIVMLAIGWLILWCCVDHSRPSKTWWPFDFRLSPAKDTQESPRRSGWTQRNQQGSRRQKQSGC